MPDSSLAVIEYLQFVLPRLSRSRVMPVWPPDVFALTMGLTARWGLYAKGLENWPPIEYHNPAKWSADAKLLGAAWKQAWSPSASDTPAKWWRSTPKLIRIEQKWQKVLSFANWKTLSFSAGSGAEAAASFLELAAIADEACCGFGLAFRQLRSGDPHKYPEMHREYFTHAEERLLITTLGEGATLCDEVSPSRSRVLPKMHTPASGLTVRSLSHNLAVLEANEIRPKWHIPDDRLGGDCLNILFVPAPSRVLPSDFKAIQTQTGSEMRNMPSQRYGFFTYDPDERRRDRLLESIPSLISIGEETVGRLHGIVLPEMAVTPEQYNNVVKDFVNRSSGEEPTQRNGLVPEDAGHRGFVVAGVRSNVTDLNGRNGRNEVKFWYGRKGGVQSWIDQSKHHRWKLDSDQIKQYGIGSQLDPEKQWWEHISVCDRSLSFVALQPWLVLSVLVCEDLARPDPVGDLIRAVGPNLVIALLMDGPQIKERWPARYATTLADDPGCSVLSVTSKGMANLSRPSSGANRSRVVGLWKAAQTSSLTEIELPPDSDAIVLSLTRRYATEWTADGRDDAGGAGYPELSGIHPISLKSLIY